MADSAVLGLLSLTENGDGSCYINAANESALVGREFTLTAADGDRTGSKQVKLLGGV